MPDAAEKLINNWVTGVLQTDLEPMEKVDPNAAQP